MSKLVSMPRLQAIKLGPLFFWLGFSLLVIFSSLFFGLIASTSSLILFALAAGLLIGLILLFNPAWDIWLLIVLGLTSTAMISFAGPDLYSKLGWGLSLIGFLLWIPSFLVFYETKRLPLFIGLSFAFVVYAILATLVQWYSFGEFLAGFKRYFQAYGLMFALAIIPFAATRYKRWMTGLLVIGLLQLPLALYERLILVPERGGLASGSDSTDVVAGTFGANLVGGSGNAEMATFLLIILAFLFSRWREKQLSGATLVLIGALIFAPLTLGETKIVVFMLPLIAVILMKNDLRDNPVRFLMIGSVFAVLVAALGYVYVTLIMRETLYEAVHSLILYNFENVGYGTNVLNRTSVLTFWWQQQGFSDPVGFFLGHGLGSAYTPATTQLPGHLSLEYPQYGIDLTAASTLLWDLGLVGFLFYLSILAAAWLAARKLYKTSTNPRTRADALAIQASVTLFLPYVFYRNTPVNFLSWEIVIALVLGYLGHLMRGTYPAKNNPKRSTGPIPLQGVGPAHQS